MVFVLGVSCPCGESQELRLLKVLQMPDTFPNVLTDVMILGLVRCV